MITEELIIYLKKKIAEGKSYQEINEILKKVDWSDADISAGFKKIGVVFPEIILEKPVKENLSESSVSSKNLESSDILNSSELSESSKTLEFSEPSDFSEPNFTLNKEEQKTSAELNKLLQKENFVKQSPLSSKNKKENIIMAVIIIIILGVGLIGVGHLYKINQALMLENSKDIDNKQIL